MLIRAHGHEDLKGMLNICYSAVVKPLSNPICKKSNFFSVYKKKKKTIAFKITVLPICGKIFERVIFNQVFECLGVNKLLTLNQSGFYWNGSCEIKLVSYYASYLYASFNNNPSLEVGANFLEIEKHLIGFGMRVFCVILKA